MLTLETDLESLALLLLSSASRLGVSLSEEVSLCSIRLKSFSMNYLISILFVLNVFFKYHFQERTPSRLKFNMMGRSFKFDVEDEQKMGCLLLPLAVFYVVL